jgi:hypothetical protein
LTPVRLKDIISAEFRGLCFMKGNDARISAIKRTSIGLHLDWWGFFFEREETSVRTDKLPSSFLIAAILLLSLILSNYAIAGTIQLPKTGQTISYYSGDDGEIQAGVDWPNPRFLDNSDGTVTDKLTGLIWTKNANPAGNYMAWLEALEYVKTLNTGGHTDWRLPNINELQSLIEYSQSNFALPQGYPFTNVQPIYWSSTSSAEFTSDAWTVGFSGDPDGNGVDDYGYVASTDKSYYYYVRAVRGGQCGSLGDSVICLPQTGQSSCYDSDGKSIDCAGTGQDGDIQAGVAWPKPRFVDNGDGTVTDNLTGLMWTANGTDEKTWQEALDWLKTLHMGGLTDWRLPNVNELRSLVDYTSSYPSLPHRNPFVYVQSDYYWSSTTYAYYTNHAWSVYFGDGYVSYHFKDDANYGQHVRAVRAGQVGGSAGTSTIFPTTTITTTTTTPTTTTTIQPTTTTTVPTNQCVAEAIYGKDSEETEMLREYRDKVLSKSTAGRQMIKTYYDLSPAVVEALQKNNTARASARRVLDSLMPAIRKKLKQ